MSFSNEEMATLRKLAADHPALLQRLDQYEAPDTKDQRFRDAAEDLNFVRDGECEIDDCAVVSWSDDGAYVMAWVWVDRTDVEPDYVPTYMRDEP